MGVRKTRGCAAAVVAAGLGAAAGAAPVDSREFFNPFSPTLTTWEVRRNGAPLTLLEGETMSLPSGEYAASGFTFSQDIAWVNDGSATFNAAQGLAGSPQIAIPSAAFNSFDILFASPTDAFGFVVINNTGATSLPSFTAYNALNQPIETVTWGAPFIDGTIGNAQYGFMGISSPANKIARISLTKQNAIFDDFLFAAIPGPGAALTLGAGLFAMGRRKRQGNSGT